MFVRELFENISRTGKGDTAVIGWGRGMGHKGHMMLASSVITKAKNIGGDPYFVVSRTVGKDDPITPDEKLAIYKKVFPQQGHIFQAASDEVPDLTRVLTNLNQQGYRNAVVVVGADQVKAFQYLKQYNGKPNKSGDIPFSFDNLEVISRQETGDPSAEEEGPRATPMRQVLMDPKATPEEQFRVWRDAMSSAISDDEVRILMNKAKERMTQFAAPKAKKSKGVAEDVASDAAYSSSPINGKSMDEDAAGVGVVATNKKMARDPRYSTSITKDVKPKTPKNMLRAFRLAENKKKSFDHQINESRQLELAAIPMIKKFLPIVKKELNLKKLPKIKVQRHVEVHDGQATFGRFVNNEQVIYIGIADRHPVDVIRTLAHELVHWKQFLDGRIEPKSGETGSPIENEAHAKAGVLLRIFNKKYPDAIKLDNIELKESKDFVSTNISYSKFLNPIAWDDDKLKPEVQDRLLKIAGEFIKYLEVPNFKIEDVVLTGSMANYNWTKYSDFDLHIITDYNHLECDDLAEILYRAKKDLWNSYHDITIGGHEVELYVEDIKDPPVSAGIFSILDNRWINKPKFDRPFIDKRAVNAKVNDLIKQINTTIKTADNEDDIQRLKDKIRKMRRAGLDKNGEFSVENLSFKILRNMGLLDKMSLRQKKIQDNRLRLEK